ncbi:MAG: aminoacyl-tRNA hydrolase [Burkholderiales bacterium]|nr:aminoacyl-tRNA hydrolase [Burkholderiales bacterium]MCE1176394.1 aminoacyl-tRNA hydrolase [Burkholderiales bacterium]
MADTTKLIVGLGNYGNEYEDTRHNAGWWLLDELAREYNVSLNAQTKFHGLAGRARIANTDVWLLKPMTYMNRSGQAIAALANFYKITPENILVLHDELDIPNGATKMKIGGSTGGHNGLKDTQAKLGTPNFWRLRIGIDHPRNSGTPLQPVVDYVLKPPKQAERLAIDDAIHKAQKAIPDWVRGDVEKAMRLLHAK